VIKSLIKKSYSGALWHSGALAAWLRLRPGRHDPWILNYHHIDPEPFESHLESLVRRYHIATLDACVDHLAGRASLPPNSVILTFDDAYEQIDRELYPLLRRYEAPATVFVPTAPVDDREPLWFNRVKTLLRTTPAGSVRLGDREFPLAGGREAAYAAAVRYLNEQSVAARDQMLRELLDGVELPAERMRRYQSLTWEQMRAMRGLVTFGGHTRTHPYLSRLPRAEAEAEILGSKARLEEMLGVEIRHFAYPFGSPASFTDETVAILESGGFVSAVTTTRGACQAGALPFRLPRILFDGSLDGRIVAARLSGLWLFLTT